MVQLESIHTLNMADRKMRKDGFFMVVDFEMSYSFIVIKLKTEKAYSTPP